MGHVHLLNTYYSVFCDSEPQSEKKINEVIRRILLKKAINVLVLAISIFFLRLEYFSDIQDKLVMNIIKIHYIF